MARHAERSRHLDTAVLPTDLDALLDNDIERAFADAEREMAPLGPHDLELYQVLRYHLGYVNASLRPERADSGKRVRPRLCLLACLAAGGDPDNALPVATAIELLHNFTLIHDDIQDASPLRRHRPTVWSLWGTPQALNAGDAMFALAHIALNRLRLRDVDANTILDLSTRMHLTTLRIVEGQALDLGFESRESVGVAEYLTMIGGKTAAICGYACWAGARVAGAGEAQANAFAAFGRAIGVGFQLRDDLLGVWGSTGDTGKAAADDIRRRKKSLPILLLLERASLADRERTLARYAQDELNEDDVRAVLELLRDYEIRPDVQAEVERWHDDAEALLAGAAPPGPAREQLAALVNQLARRPG